MGILGSKKNNDPDENLDSLIGEGSVFSGELSVKGSVRIDGRLEGKLTTTGHLTVGKKGVIISPTINCNTAHIAGSVKGDINAKEQVYLTSTAKVEGNISSSSLVIEEGAYFHGSSIMGKGKKPILVEPTEGQTKER